MIKKTNSRAGRCHKVQRGAKSASVAGICKCMVHCNFVPAKMNRRLPCRVSNMKFCSAPLEAKGQNGAGREQSALKAQE